MAVCAGERGGAQEWHATPTQLQAANTPLHSMIISKRNYSAVCGLRLVGVAGRRGGVGGGGRRWLCWVVVWQTGSYAGHTPQPPWAAHSHPPSPHQPPLHTTPTHKCLGCSPYCVHQSAGGCRPAVAPCRWGGGCGAAPKATGRHQGGYGQAFGGHQFGAAHESMARPHSLHHNPHAPHTKIREL